MVILGSALSPITIDEHIESSSSLGAVRVDELDHYDETWIPPFALKEGVRLRTNEKFSDFYELKEEIGQGKFGTVYRCIERNTGLILAAKSIRLKKDTDIKKVEREVNIMTKMRHKCITQIYDAFVTQDKDVLLVMEIVQGGELFDRVEEDSYILTEMAVALIMHQILEAIKYIHSQNIIHLDLKPENIMCVSQTSNQIKLIDFGLAQYFDGQSDLLFMAGTPEFAAPEVIRYEPLSFHTDMWSLGVITYILLSGVSPFLGETTAHTYCNVEKGTWEFCEEFTDNGISEEAKDFISKLLVFKKEKRMLPTECLQHKWIVQCRERANSSRSATPVNLPNIEKPLDVSKLRQYIRNKRFRRVVFGVMFLNSVLKMMQTFRANKSAHGIEYVKTMIKAADGGTKDVKQDAGSVLLNAFTKKKKVVTVSVEPMDTSEPLTTKKVQTVESIQKRGKENGHRNVVEIKVEPEVVSHPSTAKVATRRRSGDKGSKKKRSKSATRKTDKQRTESSTEQTTKKKQKTETGATTGDRIANNNNKVFIPLKVPVQVENNERRAISLSKSPVPRSPAAVTVKDKVAAAENKVLGDLKAKPNLEKTTAENHVLSAKIKKMVDEGGSTKQKVVEKARSTSPVKQKKTIPDSRETLLNKPGLVPITEPKKNGVSNLLKKLESKQQNEVVQQQPLKFAVAAVPLQAGSPKEVEGAKRKQQVNKVEETGIKANHFVKPTTSKTIFGELERRVQEEECTKVAKRNFKKESTVQKTVEGQLKEKSTMKSSENEVITSLYKKKTSSEKAKADPDVVENVAKLAFRSKIAEIERLSDATKLEKRAEKCLDMGVQRLNKVNNVVTDNNTMVVRDKKDKILKVDTQEGLIELQRKRLRKVQVQEAEGKNGGPAGIEVDTVQKVTVKKVKKKVVKKKTQSVDQESKMVVVQCEEEAKASSYGTNRKPPAEYKRDEFARRKTSATILPQKGHINNGTALMDVEDAGGWNAVGEEVFDFNLLKKKLQNRIMGMKDEEELAIEEENRNKCEKRVKLASNSLHVRKAMKKWFSIDKEQQQSQNLQVK